LGFQLIKTSCCCCCFFQICNCKSQTHRFNGNTDTEHNISGMWRFQNKSLRTLELSVFDTMG